MTDFIAGCEVELQGHKTRINLNILPLGSYDMIIGMDWLERNKVVLNYLSNTFTYIVEDQMLRTVKCILKLASVRQISAMELKKCIKKGCNLYVVRVADLLLNENLTPLKQHRVLDEFPNVFLEEIPGLPPQQEIEFSIELLPRSAPVSKIP